MAPYKEDEYSSIENFFLVFMIMEYIVLPTFLTFLRCFVLVNVPKMDVVLLYSALHSYSSIAFIISVFGTDVWCTNSASCHPAIHLAGTNFLAGLFFFIVSVLSFFLTLCCEIPHALSWSCGNTEAEQELPIPLQTTSARDYMEIINRIEGTGPTLAVGVMAEKERITYRGQDNRWRITTRLWRLVDWEQFPYTSWINLKTSQDSNLEFQERDNVLNCSRPMVIKTTLNIEPANSETRKKYNNWKATTAKIIMEDEKTKSKDMLEEFTEELVTDDQLSDQHQPNQLIPSIQLPSLVTCQTMATDAQQVGLHALSQDRLVCTSPPWWLSRKLYKVSCYLFLSSLYRVVYWSKVSIVNLHFSKAFNTEGEGTYSTATDIVHPYTNHVDNFVIKPMV